MAKQTRSSGQDELAFPARTLAKKSGRRSPEELEAEEAASAAGPVFRVLQGGQPSRKPKRPAPGGAG